MLTTIVTEDYLVDVLVELVQDHRKSVERGSTVPNQPRDLELSDMDRLLSDLRGAEPGRV